MTDEQIQSLVQLKELKEQGILSQEEFDKEKTSILNETKASPQQSLAGLNEGHNHSASEKEDKNEAKPQRVLGPKKKESWFKKNWWIIVAALSIALAKIISRF